MYVCFIRPVLPSQNGVEARISGSTRSSPGKRSEKPGKAAAAAQLFRVFKNGDSFHAMAARAFFLRLPEFLHAADALPA